MRRGPVRAAFALITALVTVCVASASAVEPLTWRTVLRTEAGDVRGGRYVVGTEVSPYSDKAQVFHRSASGSWSDRGFPDRRPLAVFRLPDSASLWTVGEDEQNENGVVMRYDG